MLPESSRMNITFGLFDVVAVPSGSVAMFSSPACAGRMLPSRAAIAAAVRLVSSMRFMTSSAADALVEYCLHIAHRVARSDDAYRDTVVNGAGAGQGRGAVGHDALGAVVRGGAAARAAPHALVERIAGGQRLLAQPMDDVAHLVAGGVRPHVACSAPVEVVGHAGSVSGEVQRLLPGGVIRRIRPRRVRNTRELREDWRIGIEDGQ